MFYYIYNICMQSRDSRGTAPLRQRDGLFMLLERDLATWSYDYLDWKRTGKQGQFSSSLLTEKHLILAALSLVWL